MEERIRDLIDQITEDAPRGREPFLYYIWNNVSEDTKRTLLMSFLNKRNAEMINDRKREILACQDKFRKDMKRLRQTLEETEKEEKEVREKIMEEEYGL